MQDKIRYNTVSDNKGGETWEKPFVPGVGAAGLISASILREHHQPRTITGPGLRKAGSFRRIGASIKAHSIIKLSPCAIAAGINGPLTVNTGACST